MPFMKGKSPVRRTLQYLNAGRLVLKDSIDIFSLNYNTNGDHHEGARKFVFWNIPQVQFKNPNVQVVLHKNLTPTPFIKCYYKNGKKMLIDVDNKTNDEILDHLINVVGKSKEILEKEAIAAIKKENPANIGNGCSKHCICEVPGQLPCPSIVPLPLHMRGKYYLNPDSEIYNKN